MFLDCLAILADKDLRDRSASQGFQEQMERREAGASEGSLDHADREDPLDPEVKEDLGEQLESPGLRERQAAMDLLAPQERGVFQDLREPTDSQDLKDLQDLQEKTDSPDTLDREEKWDSKAKLDLLVRLVSSDLRVHRERPAHWESAATLDPQGPLESKV